MITIQIEQTINKWALGRWRWRPPSFKYQESKVISMCEILERKTRTRDLPYDLEEPADERDITRGLMRLSQRTLSKYMDTEPDIY